MDKRPLAAATSCSLPLLAYFVIERGLNKGWATLADWRAWAGPLVGAAAAFLVAWLLAKLALAVLSIGDGKAT